MDESDSSSPPPHDDDDCNELPLPKELDQQPDVSLTQRESMYSDIAASLTQYAISDDVHEEHENEETKPPINNDVCNKQDDDHEVDDDHDVLNEHTVGSEDEDEDDREIDASNHSIGSWGMSNINELQPPLSDAQIAESVWNVVAAADRDDNNVHDDKQLAAKIKKYGETKATVEDEDSTNSNNGTNSATSDVQTDIESQRQEQLNTEEADIATSLRRQSSVSWAERVDEYLNESTEDEEEVGLSGLQRIRSIASNMLSLRSIPIANSTSRRSSVIQAVVTRRPRSRSMVEAHSSRSNESGGSQRRASLPAQPHSRNTTIGDLFGSIVQRQRRHNPLARSSSGNNQALRDLSEMMGEITAVEAYAVDESLTERVDAIPVDMIEMETQRLRKRRRLKRQIYLIWGPLLLVVVVVVAVAVVNGPGSKTVEVQEDQNQVVDYDDPTIQLKDGILSCGLKGTNTELCNAIAAVILGSEYQGDVIEVDVTLHLQEGER